MSSRKSKTSQKSRKVKSKSRKSKASQKSRQSIKQSKRLEREIKLSKEMSKRMSKKTPMIASSHGISLLKRSKRNMSKGRPLASARDFLLATSILTAALSPYDPHPMAKKSQIAPDTQVHLDWHKGQFPDKQLTSKQYKKLMKRSKKSKRLSTIQEGGMKKKKKRTKKNRKKTRKKRGGNPVLYNELIVTHPLLIRNNGNRVYDMKNKKNNVVQKVRITEKLERDGKEMIKFQRVYQVLDGSPGLPSVISGRYEGYTPYGDHTGPWTYITPYDDVELTKHISTAKAAKLGVGIGLYGGRRKKKKTKRTRRK